MTTFMANPGNNRLVKFALNLSPGLLFIIPFIYFYCFGKGLFFYQESRSLFIFSGEYFHNFIIKPGGLLEYAGNFLTQGYYNKTYGSLVLSLSFILFIVLFTRIKRTLSANDPDPFLISLIPGCLLLILQSQYDHFLYQTLGYLFLTLYLLFSIILEKKGLYPLIPVLFPLLFYIAGSFSLIFTLIYTCYCLTYYRGAKRFIRPFIMIMTALITFVLFKEILFLQPVESLLKYPLSKSGPFNILSSGIPLTGYMGLFPLIVKLGEKEITSGFSGLFFTGLPVLVTAGATIFFLGFLNDPEREKDLRIKELFADGNLDEIIRLQENDNSVNPEGLFYYYLTLTEKGQLCERMFHAVQNYSTSALFPEQIPEDLTGAFYFYYAIGMNNEARHRAFESMVLEGYRPENLKMLVKTELLNGNYRSAAKYINILKRTLHHRKWAGRFEKMPGNPATVASDPELGEKIKLLPELDFFSRSGDVENIDLMLMTDPGNKKAFEYKMAWLLLEKDYKSVMYQVKKMKEMNYTRIPRHIEEAMMIFINRKHELPYLGDLNVSSDTENRFGSFLEELSNNKTVNRPEPDKSMKVRWDKTYWYYFEFK